MATVSVEKSVVEKSIVLCDRTIQQYRQIAAYLDRQYLAAGNGWNDAKYRQLGNVVHGCTNALTRPLAELEECLGRLREFLKTIERYENENL